MGVINCDQEDIQHTPEEIKKLAEQLWDKTAKPKTLSQLKAARKNAKSLVNYLDECIEELKEQESLEQQFKRIIGIDIPNRRLSIEEYRKYILIKFNNWCAEDKQFFVDNFHSILPLSIVKFKNKYL